VPYQAGFFPELDRLGAARPTGYTGAVSDRWIRIAVLLILAAVCVDLCGQDCRRLLSSPLATGHAGTDELGSDCLCCSSGDLPAPAPHGVSGALISVLGRAPDSDPTDGVAAPPYRPPLA
jgi:hypothetical protein